VVFTAEVSSVSDNGDQQLGYESITDL
jgi:hypothetical protein